MGLWVGTRSRRASEGPKGSAGSLGEAEETLPPGEGGRKLLVAISNPLEHGPDDPKRVGRFAIKNIRSPRHSALVTGRICVLHSVLFCSTVFIWPLFFLFAEKPKIAQNGSPGDYLAHWPLETASKKLAGSSHDAPEAQRCQK